MTDERIEKTKSAVESAGNIPADKKAELLGLLSKLKPAIAKVSQTHQEDAQSIARLVEASAQETIRAQKKPERIKRLSHELKQSVETFEASHPELVASRQRACFGVTRERAPAILIFAGDSIKRVYTHFIGSPLRQLAFAQRTASRGFSGAGRRGASGLVLIAVRQTLSEPALQSAARRATDRASVRP